MKKIKKFLNSKVGKCVTSFAFAFVMCLAMSALCFAADGDTSITDQLTTIANSAVDSIVTSLITIVGVIAVGVTSVLCIKIGVQKTFAYIQNMIQ